MPKSVEIPVIDQVQCAVVRIHLISKSVIALDLPKLFAAKYIAKIVYAVIMLHRC